VNQLVSSALAEKLSALDAERYLNERAVRGGEVDMNAFLARISMCTETVRSIGFDHQSCRIPFDPVAVPPPLGQFLPEPLREPCRFAFPGTPRGDQHYPNLAIPGRARQGRLPRPHVPGADAGSGPVRLSPTHGRGPYTTRHDTPRKGPDREACRRILHPVGILPLPASNPRIWSLLKEPESRKWEPQSKQEVSRPPK
jgi:hypothetical protein